MSKHFDNVKVGLRDKDTGKLIAVYPGLVNGSADEIRDKVFYWYYQQSCSAEHELERSYLDVLSDNELRSLS